MSLEVPEGFCFQLLILVRKEIASKQELGRSLVGNLYASIVFEDICKLREYENYLLRLAQRPVK